VTPITALLFFLAWLVPQGPQHREREPNDEPAAATPLARTRTGAPGFLTGRFADGWVEHGRLAPGDVDYSALAARAGDLLLVSVAEPGRGAFADPVLAVLGPGDTEPVVLDDDAGPNFLPRATVPIDRTGVWTIAVAGFGDEALDGDGHDERFAYDLVVAVAANAVAVAERDGRGGNDTRARAEPVPVWPGRATVIEGQLVPGDVDHFLLPLPPRTLLTASLFDDAAGAFNDSRLEVRDLAGRLIVEDDDAGPGFLSNVALAGVRVHGPVVVRVTGFDPDPDDDRGHEERFRYRLVVSARKTLPIRGRW
jgi:hypothetical protein